MRLKNVQRKLIIYYVSPRTEKNRYYLSFNFSLSWSPIYANFTLVSDVFGLVAMTTDNAVRRTLQYYSSLFYTIGDLISRASHVARLHGQEGGNIIMVIFYSNNTNNFDDCFTINLTHV